MLYDVMKTLQTIRDNASKDYQEIVPHAERENLKTVGKAITSDKNIMNEFMEMLINKVAFTEIKSKLYKNPLAKLKKNKGVPYGSVIEELFINPATDIGYQKDPNYLLKNTTPDGKSAYYGMNRQGNFPVSISIVQLEQAFQNEQAFQRFYDQIISSLYSGDNVKEYELMKGVITENIKEGHIKKVEVNLEQPKAFSKAITNLSKLFTFDKTDFSPYNLVNAVNIKSGEKPVKTFCELKDQVLIIRSDVATELSYEVLATAFNIDEVRLKAMTIEIDEFPFQSDRDAFEIYGCLMDRESVQVIDKLLRIESNYNGSNLYMNFWLHHWQYIYFSMFPNAVCFVKPNFDFYSGEMHYNSEKSTYTINPLSNDNKIKLDTFDNSTDITKYNWSLLVFDNESNTINKQSVNPEKNTSNTTNINVTLPNVNENFDIYLVASKK